ncbi:PrgI family protein [Patescibacteria group bacterium]|nr:PrgI family protein [Patescibacteria group bacterium]
MATRFQVPQFIEHEAKVVGPFTLKQALYVLMPGAVVFFLFFVLPTTPWVILAILLLGGGVASAFIKIEGKALPSIVLSFLRFSASSKNYLWQKGKIRVKPGQQMEYGTPIDPQQGQPENDSSATIQMAQGSKLQSLSTRVETEK